MLRRPAFKAPMLNPRPTGSDSVAAGASGRASNSRFSALEGRLTEELERAVEGTRPLKLVSATYNVTTDH